MRVGFKRDETKPNYTETLLLNRKRELASDDYRPYTGDILDSLTKPVNLCI